jgi:hypothetical protein
MDLIRAGYPHIAVDHTVEVPRLIRDISIPNGIGSSDRCRRPDFELDCCPNMWRNTRFRVDAACEISIRPSNVCVVSPNGSIQHFKTKYGSVVAEEEDDDDSSIGDVSSDISDDES